MAFTHDYEKLAQQTDGEDILGHCPSCVRHHERSAWQKSFTRRESLVYLSLTVLFGALVFVAVLAFTKVGLSLLDDDILPHIPTELRTITRTPESEVNQTWETLHFEDLGFIYVPNPQEHALPPGLPLNPGDERKKYGLSWGHQLHCLKMVRDEYQALQRQESKQITSHGEGEKSLDKITRRRIHHIDHCFDYLRQNIQCNSDMTIEWADPEPDELGNPYHINGYGVQHQCRKRESVYQYSMDRALPDFGVGDLKKGN